jgi:hypothetical protein
MRDIAWERIQAKKHKGGPRRMERVEGGALEKRGAEANEDEDEVLVLLRELLLALDMEEAEEAEEAETEE